MEICGILIEAKTIFLPKDFKRDYRNFKTKYLDDWEKRHKEFLANLMKKDSLLEKLIVSRLIPLRIEVKDVQILVKNTITSIDNPHVISVNLSSLTSFGCNEKFENILVQNEDMTSIYRVVKVTKLYFNIYSEKMEDYGKTTDTMSNFIQPFDLELKIVFPKTTKGKFAKNLLKTSKLKMDITVNTPLVIDASISRLNFLISFLNYINKMRRIEKYWVHRPDVREDDKINETISKEWFKYIFRIIREEVRAKKQKNQDFATLIEKIIYMERYIILYKASHKLIIAPWIHFSDCNDDLKQLENKMNLEDIIYCREIAFTELIAEGRTYCSSGEIGEGYKPLIHLWEFYVNDLRSKWMNKKESSTNIELTPSERRDLMTIKNLDKDGVMMSYLKDEQNHPFDMLLSLNVNIEMVIFSFSRSVSVDDEYEKQLFPFKCKFDDSLSKKLKEANFYHCLHKYSTEETAKFIVGEEKVEEEDSLVDKDKEDINNEINNRSYNDDDGYDSYYNKNINDDEVSGRTSVISDPNNYSVNVNVDFNNMHNTDDKSVYYINNFNDSNNSLNNSNANFQNFNSTNINNNMNISNNSFKNNTNNNNLNKLNSISNLNPYSNNNFIFNNSRIQNNIAKNQIYPNRLSLNNNSFNNIGLSNNMKNQSTVNSFKPRLGTSKQATQQFKQNTNNAYYNNNINNSGNFNEISAFKFGNNPHNVSNINLEKGRKSNIRNIAYTNINNNKSPFSNAKNITINEISDNNNNNNNLSMNRISELNNTNYNINNVNNPLNIKAKNTSDMQDLYTNNVNYYANTNTMRAGKPEYFRKTIFSIVLGIIKYSQTNYRNEQMALGANLVSFKFIDHNYSYAIANAFKQDKADKADKANDVYASTVNLNYLHTITESLEGDLVIRIFEQLSKDNEFDLSKLVPSEKDCANEEYRETKLFETCMIKYFFEIISIQKSRDLLLSKSFKHENSFIQDYLYKFSFKKVDKNFDKTTIEDFYTKTVIPYYIEKGFLDKKIEELSYYLKKPHNTIKQALLNRNVVYKIIENKTTKKDKKEIKNNTNLPIEVIIADIREIFKFVTVQLIKYFFSVCYLYHFNDKTLLKAFKSNIQLYVNQLTEVKGKRKLFFEMQMTLMGKDYPNYIENIFQSNKKIDENVHENSLGGNYNSQYNNTNNTTTNNTKKSFLIIKPGNVDDVDLKYKSIIKKTPAKIIKIDEIINDEGPIIEEEEFYSNRKFAKDNNKENKDKLDLNNNNANKETFNKKLNIDINNNDIINTNTNSNEHTDIQQQALINSLKISIKSDFKLEISNETLSEIKITIIDAILDSKIKLETSGNIFAELKKSYLDIYDNFRQLRAKQKVLDYLETKNQEFGNIESNEMRYLKSKSKAIEKLKKDSIKLNINISSISVTLIDKMYFLTHEKICPITVRLRMIELSNSNPDQSLPIESLFDMRKRPLYSTFKQNNINNSNNEHEKNIYNELSKLKNTKNFDINLIKNVLQYLELSILEIEVLVGREKMIETNLNVNLISNFIKNLPFLPDLVIDMNSSKIHISVSPSIVRMLHNLSNFNHYNEFYDFIILKNKIKKNKEPKENTKYQSITDHFKLKFTNALNKILDNEKANQSFISYLKNRVGTIIFYSVGEDYNNRILEKNKASKINLKKILEIEEEHRISKKSNVYIQEKVSINDLIDKNELNQRGINNINNTNEGELSKNHEKNNNATQNELNELNENVNNNHNNHNKNSENLNNITNIENKCYDRNESSIFNGIKLIMYVTESSNYNNSEIFNSNRGSSMFKASTNLLSNNIFSKNEYVSNETRDLPSEYASTQIYTIYIPLFIFSYKKNLFYEDKSIWTSDIKTLKNSNLFDLNITFNSENHMKFTPISFLLCKYMISSISYLDNNRHLTSLSDLNFNNKDFPFDRSFNSSDIKLNEAFSSVTYYYEKDFQDILLKLYQTNINSSFKIILDNLKIKIYSGITNKLYDFLSNMSLIQEDYKTIEKDNFYLLMKNELSGKELHPIIRNSNNNLKSSYQQIFNSPDKNSHLKMSNVKNKNNKVLPHDIVLSVKNLKICYFHGIENSHDNFIVMLILKKLNYNENVSCFYKEAFSELVLKKANMIISLPKNFYTNNKCSMMINCSNAINNYNNNSSDLNKQKIGNEIKEKYEEELSNNTEISNKSNHINKDIDKNKNNKDNNATNASFKSDLDIVKNFDDNKKDVYSDESKSNTLDNKDIKKNSGNIKSNKSIKVINIIKEEHEDINITKSNASDKTIDETANMNLKNNPLKNSFDDIKKEVAEIENKLIYLNLGNIKLSYSQKAPLKIHFEDMISLGFQKRKGGSINMDNYLLSELEPLVLILPNELKNVENVFKKEVFASIKNKFNNVKEKVSSFINTNKASRRSSNNKNSSKEKNSYTTSPKNNIINKSKNKTHNIKSVNNKKKNSSNNLREKDRFHTAVNTNTKETVINNAEMNDLFYKEKQFNFHENFGNNENDNNDEDNDNDIDITSEDNNYNDTLEKCKSIFDNFDKETNEYNDSKDIHTDSYLEFNNIDKNTRKFELNKIHPVVIEINNKFIESTSNFNPLAAYNAREDIFSELTQILKIMTQVLNGNIDYYMDIKLGLLNINIPSTIFHYIFFFINYLEEIKESLREQSITKKRLNTKKFNSSHEKAKSKSPHLNNNEKEILIKKINQMECNMNVTNVLNVTSFAVNISLSQYMDKTYKEFLNIHLIKPNLFLDLDNNNFVNIYNPKNPIINFSKLGAKAEDLLLLPSEGNYKSLILKKNTSNEELVKFEYYLNIPTDLSSNDNENIYNNKHDNINSNYKTYNINKKGQSPITNNNNNLGNNLLSTGDLDYIRNNPIISKILITINNIFVIPVYRSIKEIPFFFEKNLEIFKYLKNKVVNPDKLRKDDEMFKIQINNSSVLFPESSYSSNMLIVNSQTIKIQIFESNDIPSLEIKHDNPKKKTYLIDKDMLFNIKSIKADKESKCPCIKVNVEVENAEGFFYVDNEFDRIIQLGYLKLEILSFLLNNTIAIDLSEKWKNQHKGSVVLPKPEITIELNSADLSTSVGKLLALKHFILNNVDEKSSLFNEVSKNYQNIELNINVSKANTNVKIFKTPKNYYENMEQILKILPGGNRDINNIYDIGK